MADLSRILSDWRTQAGLHLSWLKLGTVRRQTPISINGVVGSTKRLIVCLPFNEGETLPAAQMIRDLAATLDISRIALVVHQDRVPELTDEFSRRGMILYSEEDIGFFGWPKKHLVAQVTARSWDLAIDLHRPFDFATAFLCASSGARVRIGFRTFHREGPRLFNLEYESKSPGKSPREVYDDLARFIEALCLSTRRQETGGRRQETENSGSCVFDAPPRMKTMTFRDAQS